MDSEKIIVDVEIEAQDAIVQAERVGGSIKQLVAQQKALRSENKQTGVTYQSNALVLRALQREQKAYITVANQASGSNNQLKGQLSLLTAQYDALSKAERDSTTAGKGLQLQIASINRELLTSEGSTGRFGRNFANYPGGITASLQSSVSGAASNLATSGGFGFLPQGFSAIYTEAKQSISFVTQALKDQQTATELSRISTERQQAATASQAEAEKLAAEAIAAKTRAEQAEARAVELRIEAESELLAIQTANLEQEEAELAILAQLGREQAALIAEEQARIATNEALAATELELAAAEEARAASEVQVAATTAAAAAATQAAASRSTAAASAFKLAGGIILAAIAAIGAAVFNFATQLDSVADGWEVFKSRASGAFTELGRIVVNTYEKGGMRGVLKQIFTDFGSITKATKEAGDEMAKLTGRFQDLEDKVQINDYLGDVVQNEVANLRLRARNLKLSNDERQTLLKEANRIETDYAEKTTKLHEEQVAEAVNYANATGRVRYSLSRDEQQQLKNGNLTLAKELQNSDRISNEAFEKIRAAYSNRNEDIARANQQLEKIQNDQDKYAERAAEQAKKRQEELSKVRQQDIEAEMGVAQAMLTARQREIDQLVHSYDEKIALHRKYNQSTEKLVTERNVKLEALNNKFYEEDISQLQASLDRVSEMRIAMMANGEEKEAARLAIRQEKERRALDKDILDRQVRVAKGENDQTGLLLQLQEERQVLLKKQEQEALDASVAAKAALPEDQQPITMAAIREQEAAANLQALDDEQRILDARMQMNNQLLDSYNATFGGIISLLGENTTAGKAALIAQKTFVAAQLLLNTQTEISAIRVAAANEAKWLSGIPIVGPALAAARYAVMGVQIAAAIAARVQAVAEIGKAVVSLTSTPDQKRPGFESGGMYVSDGKGALLPGYSKKDNINSSLRSGEAVIVSEATRDVRTRRLLSAINVAYGGRPFASGGIYPNNTYGGTYVQTLGMQAEQRAEIQALAKAIQGITIVTKVQDVISAVDRQNEIIDAATF